MTQTMDQLRIDKWLWAARFYKTRALATKAVNGGRVHLNGERAKAAKGVKIGDQLAISRGQETLEIHVLGLAPRRGPAKEAAGLYEESEVSVARRQAVREHRRLERATRPGDLGRPDKKQRRERIRFTGKR